MSPEKDRIKKIKFADQICPLCMGSGLVSEIGLHLRRVRERLGLSRDVVAEYGMISAETIRNVEIGKARPRLSTLVCLRKALRKLGAEEEEIDKIR